MNSCNHHFFFVCYNLFLFVPITFDDLLIIFIKIYASNFVLHVVTSLLGAGNASTNSDLYVFRGEICGARRCGGIRKRIYSLAESCQAMYHPTNKEQSIFYPADRDDLLVTLLFKSEEKFIAFVASMSHLKELFSRAQFSFSKHCETISSIQNVTNEFVLEVEYQKGNSTSPDQSRNNT